MTKRIISLIITVVLALPAAACGKAENAAAPVFEEIRPFETESATPDTEKIPGDV